MASAFKISLSYPDIFFERLSTKLRMNFLLHLMAVKKASQFTASCCTQKRFHQLFNNSLKQEIRMVPDLAQKSLFPYPI